MPAPIRSGLCPRSARQSKWNQKNYGRNDCVRVRQMSFKSVEKDRGVIDGEREVRNCEEKCVTCA